MVTSGAQAELGRALGGYVNVVTRSGTNVLRGSGYVYGRDDALNAANPLSGTTLPMRQVQFGGSAGGPIVRNRTFYFVNAERRDLDQTGLVTISPVPTQIVNARLAAVGYRGPMVRTGIYDNPVNSTNVLAKLDHQVNGRDQLSLRYSLYDAGARNARGAGGLNAPSASSGLDNLDQALAVSNTATFGFRTVLETRGQVARGDLQAPPTDPIGPAVSIAGVASFGRLSNSPTGRINRMYQIVNNLSHQRGAHALRAGVDLLHNDNRVLFPRAVGGTYAFSSLPNFLAGVYNNSGFTQTFGATGVDQTNPNPGSQYTGDDSGIDVAHEGLDDDNTQNDLDESRAMATADMSIAGNGAAPPVPVPAPPPASEPVRLSREELAATAKLAVQSAAATAATVRLRLSLPCSSRKRRNTPKSIRVRLSSDGIASAFMVPVVRRLTRRVLL